MSTLDNLWAPWKSLSRIYKIVALILGLILLLTWFFKLGCVGSAATSAAAPVPAPVAAVASAPAALGWDWADGKLTLTGVVKDEGAKKAVYDAAVKKMGDASKVIDKLTINPSAPAIGFTDKLMDLAGWGVDGRGMRLAGNTVTLTGTVPVDGEKKQRGEAAALYFGSGYTIDNQIVVAAPSKVEPVSLFFNTGKFNVQTDAKDLLGGLIAYANASPNAKLQVSGFHDKRGSVAANKELAKNRALAVRDVLKAAGVPEDRVILVPAQELVGSADDKQARRVDVSVAQ